MGISDTQVLLLLSSRYPAVTRPTLETGLDKHRSNDPEREALANGLSKTSTKIMYNG